MAKKKPSARREPREEQGDDAREYDTLSTRDKVVLQRVAEGYSRAEIGRMLRIAPATVDQCTRRIAKRFGFRNRLDYLRLAEQLGLIRESRVGTIMTGAHP